MSHPKPMRIIWIQATDGLTFVDERHSKLFRDQCRIAFKYDRVRAFKNGISFEEDKFTFASDLPRKSLVGLALVDDQFWFEPEHVKDEKYAWATGPFCYHICDAIELPEPIEFPGNLGLIIAYDDARKRKFAQARAQPGVQEKLNEWFSLYSDRLADKEVESLVGISIQQPFAQAVVQGFKNIENRKTATSVRILPNPPPSPCAPMCRWCLDEPPAPGKRCVACHFRCDRGYPFARTTSTSESGVLEAHHRFLAMRPTLKKELEDEKWRPCKRKRSKSTAEGPMNKRQKLNPCPRIPPVDTKIDVPMDIVNSVVTASFSAANRPVMPAPPPAIRNYALPPSPVMHLSCLPPPVEFQDANDTMRMVHCGYFPLMQLLQPTIPAQNMGFYGNNPYIAPPALQFQGQQLVVAMVPSNYSQRTPR